MVRAVGTRATLVGRLSSQLSVSVSATNARPLEAPMGAKVRRTSSNSPSTPADQS